MRVQARKKPTWHRSIEPNSMARRRLQKFSDHSFSRLDCNGDITRVGTEAQSWEQPELEQALDRVLELAADPARGWVVGKVGIEEAAVALQAEHLEVFEHLERESTGGSEFKDEQGAGWDVKSPLSPPEDQNWHYSPHHHLETVRKDFAQGDKVLFNLTRLNNEDRDSTLALLKEELTCDERGRIFILSNPVLPES